MNSGQSGQVAERCSWRATLVDMEPENAISFTFVYYAIHGKYMQLYEVLSCSLHWIQAHVREDDEKRSIL